jgi:uncharacterized membrane protein
MWDTIAVPRTLQWAIGAGATIWAALVVATPLLANSSSGSDLRFRAATFTYVAGSFICHQRPERSFHLRGLPLPVCARCSGLYGGAALGALALGAMPRLRRSAPRTARWWRTFITAAAIPTGVTLLVEWFTPVPVSNSVRALAGVVLGAAVGAFVFVAASGEVN